MKTSDHVTENQIAAFSAGSLIVEDARTIGGHLIRCVTCRSLLPTPDSSQVWTAVTREHDFGESKERTRMSHLSERAFVETIAELFARTNRLAWASGMLAIVIGMAALFFLSVSKHPGVESDVARSLEIEGPVPPFTRTDEANGEIDSPETISKSNRTNSLSTDRGLTNGGRNMNPRTARTNNLAPTAVNRDIAQTRGGSEPCSAGRTIEMGLGSSKADFLFRWKRVPKAAKYHVYVSDSDEILVDEFETELETSYVMTKPLDPTKSYKWKIVITLESGEKLYADAQKFSVKNSKSHFSGHRSKASSDTRCLTN